ncbi:family 2 glycosyl transferase [Chondrinema litorale]|uniref:family 2 glycosyl transferase n=1 Tax=Chondrinema litorale TaxID=2994555 RepID=UPI002543545F|nr:family 2 glycosyl transferase [Chondrinema litorale]UZR95064.1 family 2 glycosyl transferase [Chondrinema litorale]
MTETEAFLNSAKIYLEKYAWQPVWQFPDFKSEIKNIIVIPCYLEPDLIDTLKSLYRCKKSKFPVEVLVIINNAANASEEDKVFNRETLEQANQWIESHQSNQLKFNCVLVDDLPPKHAGVGLARRIGMDAALNYFYKTGINGIITCFDADSTVKNNYLTELEKFTLNADAGIATIAFNHQFETIGDVEKDGIIHYELFLRYYILGLRYANYPFSMHTIGSSMACKASAYARHGGMNRRKAGEDFYFIHKLAPHENHIHLKDTCVYPSCRTSFRVPFGTGKAQQEWLEGNSKIAETYQPIIFEELKTFLKQLESLFSKQNQTFTFSEKIQQFLDTQNFNQEVKRIIQNSKSEIVIRKKFFQWFDGFKTLKMVHFLRDQYYENIPLFDAAKGLLSMLNIEVESIKSTKKLLEIYREIDDK